MSVNPATLGTAPSEEQIKLAEAELFCKLAASEGIDLSTLSDEQVATLYNEFYKQAEEECPPGEKKDEPAAEKKDEEKGEGKGEEEKKEAAAREHATKLAHAAEEAHAHRLGQIMAHSYVAELSKIAAEQGLNEQPGETKEAGMPPQLAKALGKVRGAAGEAASKGKELAGKAVGAAKSNPGAAAAGAAAAGAGAGFAAGRMSKKASLSNIDQLALEQAVKIAHEGGLDPEEAAERVHAVAVLGLQDSTKLASDLESQIGIRALEYLEAAGYPVKWNDGSEQPQG